MRKENKVAKALTESGPCELLPIQLSLLYATWIVAARQEQGERNIIIHCTTMTKELSGAHAYYGVLSFLCLSLSLSLSLPPSLTQPYSFSMAPTKTLDLSRVQLVASDLDGTLIVGGFNA